MFRSITTSLAKVPSTTARFYSDKPNASQLTVMDFIARIQKNADKLGPINQKPAANRNNNHNNNSRRPQRGNRAANDFTDIMSSSAEGAAAPTRSGPSRFTRNPRDGSAPQRSRAAAGAPRGASGPKKTRAKSSRKVVRKETGSSAPFNLEAKVSQMQAAAPSKISYEAPTVNTENLKNLTADLVYSVENCIRNARKILSELPETERDAQTIDRVVAENIRGELTETLRTTRKGVSSAVTTLNQNGSIETEDKKYAMGIINGEFKPAPLK